MTFGQYTSCVQPKDYKDPLPGVTTDNVDFFGIVSKLIAGGGLELVKALCAYDLGGKLICLGGDRCAIGHITDFDTVDIGNKSLLDKLDNDFSIDLLLAPHDLAEFVNGTLKVNYATVFKDKMQGYLITEQAQMPIPHEQLKRRSTESTRYDGAFTHYASKSPISYGASHNPYKDPSVTDPGFVVPVLHCECEGARTFYVCEAISKFWDPISNLGICDLEVFRIPLGKIACFLLSLSLVPLLFAPLLQAWFAARDGDPNDARLDPESGSLGLGDLIVISGRWSYDAGHSGWNELHPVKTIQKVDPNTSAMGDFQTFYQKWCDRTGEVPPPTDPGVPPIGMTPTQQTVFNNQLQPENRWYFHPLLDGCEPSPIIQ